MLRRSSLALLALASCKSSLTDVSPPPPDLAYLAGDLAGADLAPPADLAQCSRVDAGANGCPCAMGLCRAATGRLSVQVQQPNGQLVLEVMDDNGCNRHIVSSETPVGVPRWAHDGKRLAFITAKQSSVLHVIGVAADGTVTCSTATPLAIAASELAWAGDHELWLLAPAKGGGPGVLARFGLRGGVSSMTTTPATEFDALYAPGAEVLAINANGMSASLEYLPSSSGTQGQTSLGPLMGVIGSVRLASDGKSVVYSAAGLHVWTPNASMVDFGDATDHSPAFSPDGRAVVYTTDDGRLLIHHLGAEAPPDEQIPSTWKTVYSPDWTPPPDSCDPLPDCT